MFFTFSLFFLYTRYNLVVSQVLVVIITFYANTAAKVIILIISLNTYMTAINTSKIALKVLQQFFCIFILKCFARVNNV